MGIQYMSELSDRFIKRIVAQHPVTYTKLEELAVSNGYTQHQVMDAMELVHKDKRITQSTRGDEMVYRPYIAPPVKEPFKSTVPYPYPGRDGVPPFVMPFPEWDLSFIFLTPEEYEEYKAKAKGRTFIPKKRYEHGNTRRQNTTRDIETLTSTQRALLAQSAVDV